MSLRGPDRAFDKQKLSKEIFSNPSSREKVEAVVHKAVLEDFLLWRASRQEPWVVFESAIALTRPLFDGVYQLVLLVTAPIPQRIDRVVKRSGLSPSEVLSRMKSQQYDLLRADAVINNDSDLQTLRSRTDIAVNLLVKLKYLLNLQDK